MSEAHGRSAAQLRAMGIQHELIDDDDGLVEMVQLLIDLGVELVDMIDEDLTFLGAPRMIRPDASIEPSDVFSGVTDDPEFRSALLAYLEWGTRLAFENSQPGATPPMRAPVPKWGWGVAPPYQP